MARAVLDIGKTLSKLTVWAADGTLLARETRTNNCVVIDGLRRLDVAGIDAWLGETLAGLARHHPIEAIFPVGHGAAAVIVHGDGSFAPPLDYEQEFDAELQVRYRAIRDPFVRTGSPQLPNGLNLGIQLFHLAEGDPRAFEDATILPWPQFWAWRLCGVMANEYTSMGCHTDLWCPVSHQSSELARRLGVSDRFAPLRAASDVLGTLTTEWTSRTGLSPETAVYCGMHDSNAALIAARSFPEIASEEATVLSTGTWFIAMRSPERAATIDIAALDEARDCLLNIDAFGTPIPSARFMGGREIEAQIEIDTRRVDIRPDQPALLAAVPTVVARMQMLLPTLAPGTGPFPDCRAEWLNQPQDWYARRAAVCLYAALVADTCLDLVGSRERLVIEGRFAEAQVFVRALAALRPDTAVYVANAHNDVAFGALRLIEPELQLTGRLLRVDRLETELSVYKSQWHAAVAGRTAAA